MKLSDTHVFLVALMTQVQLGGLMSQVLAIQYKNHMLWSLEN